MWVDIVNIILSALSFGAIIAISIFIYYLEKKNREYERKKLVK